MAGLSLAGTFPPLWPVVPAVGTALAEQVVPVLADGRGLAAGPSQAAAGLVTAPGGAAGSGKQQAQPGQGDGPDHDAVEEQLAGGAGHVIAEHRERMGERMAAAVVGQDADHADDHRRDQVCKR